MSCGWHDQSYSIILFPILIKQVGLLAFTWATSLSEVPFSFLGFISKWILFQISESILSWIIEIIYSVETQIVDGFMVKLILWRFKLKIPLGWIFLWWLYLNKNLKKFFHVNLLWFKRLTLWNLKAKVFYHYDCIQTLFLNWIKGFQGVNINGIAIQIWWKYDTIRQGTWMD